MLSVGSTRSHGAMLRARDVSAPWRHVDAILLIVTALIAAIGLLMVYSATRRFDDGMAVVARQAVFVGLGAGAMVLVSMVDYRRIVDWWPIVYAAGMLLLVGVLTPLGATVNGTRGWYRFGPAVLQPAEIGKLAMIVAVAAFLGSVDEVDLRRLGAVLCLIGAPVLLTLAQPDLGSALVFIVAGLGMLVVGGVKLRYLTVLLLIGVAAVFAILSSDALDQYQKDRLLSFASPDSVSEEVGYNVRQAQTAISSGGLTGYGFGRGPSTRLGYVPAQQTDFIFTVAGEEFGFVGAGMLVVLFALMIWRIWRIAQLSSDQVGVLLCVGILCMLLFHIFENIGMNLGIMPITGIPLPLVSQGGSSVAATFVALGLVQSVHMHRFN